MSNLHVEQPTCTCPYNEDYICSYCREWERGFKHVPPTESNGDNTLMLVWEAGEYTVDELYRRYDVGRGILFHAYNRMAQSVPRRLKKGQDRLFYVSLLDEDDNIYWSDSTMLGAPPKAKRI